jgi:hypothetical protein
MLSNLIDSLRNAKESAPMTLPLILAAWSFIVILVAALCAAARRGDLQPDAAPSPGEAEQACQPMPVVHARVRANGQLAGRLVGVSAGEG